MKLPPPNQTKLSRIRRLSSCAHIGNKLCRQARLLATDVSGTRRICLMLKTCLRCWRMHGISGIAVPRQASLLVRVHPIHRPAAYLFRFNYIILPVSFMTWSVLAGASDVSVRAKPRRLCALESCNLRTPFAIFTNLQPNTTVPCAQQGVPRPFTRAASAQQLGSNPPGTTSQSLLCDLFGFQISSHLLYLLHQ